MPSTSKNSRHRRNWSRFRSKVSILSHYFISLYISHRNLCTRHEQYRAFEGQLKIAAKSLKPIVIHSRDAYIETFELLKKVQNSH